MQVRDLAARLVVGLEGPSPTRRELAWLAHHQPAGVILFARNVVDRPQLEQLCRQLREHLPDRSEIVADHEGGPISVLAAALGRPPAPFALGILDDPEMTRRVHRDTGRQMTAAGLDRVLAPCADVLVAMDNPVIGSRAFGTEPDHVARHVTSATIGLIEGGIAVCLKHWPGHGGTHGDSHHEPAVWGNGKLPGPFAAGVAVGADAVLVGHLGDDASSGGSMRPATLEPDELAAARKVGGSGPLLLFADDVTMLALQPEMSRLGIEAVVDPRTGLLEPASMPRAWFEALARAGCDRLLCRGLPLGAFPLPGPVDRATTFRTESDDGSLSSQRPVDPTVPSELRSEPASYAACRRLMARSSEPTRAKITADSLLWLDGTGGDRWGGTEGWNSVLCDRFTRFERWQPGDPPPRMSDARILLLTSHRPVSISSLKPAVAGLSGSPDLCVVAGHPCLAETVSRLWFDGPRYHGLYDVQLADFIAVLDESDSTGPN